MRSWVRILLFSPLYYVLDTLSHIHIWLYPLNLLLLDATMECRALIWTHDPRPDKTICSLSLSHEKPSFYEGLIIVLLEPLICMCFTTIMWPSHHLIQARVNNVSCSTTWCRSRFQFEVCMLYSNRIWSYIGVALRKRLSLIHKRRPIQSNSPVCDSLERVIRDVS